MEATTTRANYLRERRIEAGLSQRRLGEIINCSSASISRYESGDRSLSARIARQLAAVLEIEPHQLFTEPDRK
jgi:transcriptional regulator with XRE-family HTH domain